MGAHQHVIDGKLRDCTPDKRGKNPMVPWKAYQTALPSPEKVREWWRRWPDANIGMATGSFPGVIVLDCDSGDARQLVLEKGGLEKAPAVWTGTPGGIHFWIEHPGYVVKNFVKEIPGTDFRGDGGYVLLPPSLHHRGARYRWNEHTIGKPPAAMPEWLDALFQDRAAGTSGDGSSAAPLDIGAILNGVAEGERDTTLYRYACKMRGDAVPQAYAEQMIRQAARLCKPSFDEATAVAKVSAAYHDFKPNPDWSSLIDDDEETVEARIAEEAERDAWKVFDAADFLALDYPVVEWRVEGFLRDRAILFNFGAPGSIKTYIATDAAIAVSTGSLFLGQFQCQQGRVLIVQEDTIDADFQQAYLGPLIRARGIGAEDLRGHLFVAPPGGMTLGVPEKVQELCRWIEAYKPDLVIVDAFYMMHDGEGFGKDLGPIMKRLKAIRGAYNCAIWVIDHDRKGKAEASNGENPIDRLWGGRQKSAAVDAIVESRPVKGSHGETFLDIVKLRGAKPADPIRVKLYEDYRLLIEGTEEDSPKGSAHVVYEWLCREGASRTIRQIIAGTGLADRTVRGAVSELHRDGLARPFSGPGTAKTWFGIRRAEAEAEASEEFNFADEEEE